MGVPTSEVGYTPAMPRREDHEVHKDMWWHWTKKKKLHEIFILKNGIIHFLSNLIQSSLFLFYY